MIKTRLEAYVLSACAPEGRAEFQITAAGLLLSCGFELVEGVSPDAASACWLLEAGCEVAETGGGPEAVSLWLSRMAEGSLAERLLSAAWRLHPLGAAEAATFAALEAEVDAMPDDEIAHLAGGTSSEEEAKHADAA